jgi:hypothetical protein
MHTRDIIGTHPDAKGSTSEGFIGSCQDALRSVAQRGGHEPLP